MTDCLLCSFLPSADCTAAAHEQRCTFDQTNAHRLAVSASMLLLMNIPMTGLVPLQIFLP